MDDDHGRSAASRVWLTVLRATAVAVVAYAVWANALRPDSDAEDVVSSVLLILVALLAAAASASVAVDPRPARRVRTAWLLFGGASLANAVAEALWLVFAQMGLDPFPSAADAFYLAYYPLFLAGLLALPAPPANRTDRQVLALDLVIGLASSFIVWWYFVLSRQVAPGPDPATLVGLLYPVGDAILLALLLTRLEQSWDLASRRIYLVLGLSVAATLIADGLFAYFEANALAYTFPPLNVLWILSSTLLLWAARTQAELAAHGDDLAPTSPRRLNWIVFPYFAIAVGAGVVAGGVFASPMAPPVLLRGAIAGLLALTLLVLARQYLVLRENTELQARAEVAAATDELTGLFNRRHFERALQLEVRRCERFGRELSLLMIDLDGLKEVNDTRGHAAGDDVLRTAADLLRSTVRSIDLAARIGGDEFAILLPETPRHSARQAAERLAVAFAHRHVAGRPLMLSIGIGSYAVGRSPSEILRDADDDLYRSRRERRGAENL